MFKLSKANISKLRKLIGSDDASKAFPLVDFHIKWSEDMPLLFPLGSESSTFNGSDSGLDIWDNPIGFKTAIKQYNLKSIALQKSLKSADPESINETFKSDPRFTRNTGINRFLFGWN